MGYYIKYSDYNYLMITKSGNSTSIRAFLPQIIDYAGLYPPASLSLEEAIHNYVKYQKDDDAWMLSRFIVPAKRLAEVSELAEHVFPPESLLSFSVLGRSGKDPNEFLENLKLDLANILAFRELHGTGVLVDMFEVVLPASALIDNFTAHDLVKKTADVLNKNGLAVFFEVPFGEEWQVRAERLIRALRKVKDKHVGFKLRTGGVSADAFPTLWQVAWAIASVRDAGVPIKATAGLHHPIRHYDESVQTKMHGFLNVFGAGILTVTNNLPIEQIKAILEDEEPSSFSFDEIGFAWKELRVATSEIKRARHHIVSFGSCSFDEPREDLRSLGFLA
jgi:hypothetical protein